MTEEVVRRTCDWPVLNSIYRLTYHIAAGAFGRLAKSNKSIVGIYVHGRYALGTWIPGVSDIDLAVVWRRAKRHEVDDLYKRHDHLRSYFPMLGEIQMLDERHVEAWTSHGIDGLESNGWIKLAGEHCFRSCYAGNERLDRVRKAVEIYRYHLHGRRASDQSAFLKVAAKLLRQLGRPFPEPCSRSRLMAICLRELSAAIASIPCDNGGATVDYSALLGEVASEPRRTVASTPVHCLALLGRANDTTPRYVLVSSDVERVDCDFGEAIVMDPSVFKFYLCFLDPLEYLILLRGRTVFFGYDPLASPYPLSENSLLETVRHSAVHLLTFPYRREVPNLPSNQFRDLLYGYFLRILRYLEDGRIEFQYDSLREYFGGRHLETVVTDRFELLFGIADDVSKHLIVPAGDR